MTFLVNWRVRIQRLIRTCKDGGRERALVIRVPHKSIKRPEQHRGRPVPLSSPSYGSRIAGTQKPEASLGDAAKTLFLNETKQSIKGTKQ